MNGHHHPLETSTRAAQLQVCTECHRPFVVPRSIVDILDADRYLVELGCANCGHTVLAQHFDEELDRELVNATAQIRAAVEVIETVDDMMRLDRFAEALHADHILPEDF